MRLDRNEYTIAGTGDAATITVTRETLKKLVEHYRRVNIEHVGDALHMQMYYSGKCDVLVDLIKLFDDDDDDAPDHGDTVTAAEPYLRKGEKVMGYTLGCDLYRPMETTAARLAEWNAIVGTGSFISYLDGLGFVMAEDIFTVIECEAGKRNYYIPGDEGIQTYEY